MASTAHNDPSKLIRLSDHRRRLPGSLRRPTTRVTDRSRGLHGEASWLTGALLMTAAGGVTVGLLAGFTGLGLANPRGEGVALAPLLSHLLQAGVSFTAGWRLRHMAPATAPWIGVAGGSLVTLALSDIGQLTTGAAAGPLDGTSRLGIFALGVAAGIGVWAASFALRLSRGPDGH